MIHPFAGHTCAHCIFPHTRFALVPALERRTAARRAYKNTSLTYIAKYTQHYAGWLAAHAGACARVRITPLHRRHIATSWCTSCVLIQNFAPVNSDPCAQCPRGVAWRGDGRVVGAGEFAHQNAREGGS